MVKQVIDVDGYWEVIVFWNLDFGLFSFVENEMRNLGMSEEGIEDVYQMMKSGKAKAVTCSNEVLHKSIVVFNRHENKIDYINSVVHEAEHIKQAMLRAYSVEDAGEDPAYTIGYLVGKMWKCWRRLGLS